MCSHPPRFADLALPVPLDQTFTYLLPETTRHRAQVGARAIATLGNRKLSGVIVKLHDQPPEQKPRQILRLLDEEPALSAELLALGRWIGDYYCTPIGEVLRTMLPLGGETRKTTVVSLTARGQEAARQFSRSATPDDPFVKLLRALEKRPLTLDYLKKRLPGSDTALRSLKRKRWLTVESGIATRDPLLARGGRLVVSAGDFGAAPAKLTRGERWLVDYLREHAGSHDITDLEPQRKDVARVARRLAKASVVTLTRIPLEQIPEAGSKEQPVLNADQEAAFRAVKKSIERGKFQTFLLHGVTGSGKTEVYLRAIEEVLRAGKSALLLVPEIALTPAVAAEFFVRFAGKVAILHSAFSGLERSDQWRRVRGGEARVVVGTRSGVFAPVSNLGLVIVDEEHDGGYKQGEAPRYNGRDVAVMRAKAAGATVVLGSATPSLESRYNAERGKYQLLRLPSRVEQRPLPEVAVVDMKQEFSETGRQGLFSRALEDAIEQRLQLGQQVILLLNRRGFSSFVTCRGCGERIECQNCSVTLTHHRREKRLMCHYCDYTEPVPSRCPKCTSEHIYFIGSGSEKVEDHLRERYPRARIVRLDRDSVRGRGQYENILREFREGAYDILVGTQMVAKGHDVANVTLVGVVSADVGLGMPDFRAAERTFQLLTQVAGRAGRGELLGEVLLQTLNTDHYAIEFAARQDYEGFYKKELHFRRMMRYPPFTAMASLIVRGKKLEEALRLSGELGRRFAEPPEGVRVMGPAAAPMVKLKTDFRYQFLIKARSRKKLSELLATARRFAMEKNWPPTALVIDVDPLSLM